MNVFQGKTKAQVVQYLGFLTFTDCLHIIFGGYKYEQRISKDLRSQGDGGKDL